MEFVDGRELKEYFAADERFRPGDIVRIMTQILAALEYSHRQGVVHRDIKPANIFLLPDGTVKVADFGIAHIESSNLTQVGTVVGTPNYMSPEQIMGLPVDGRSDLFSAGVILYQFLTGERPFAGSSTTTMQKVLKEEPLPPSHTQRAASAGDRRGGAQGACKTRRRPFPVGAGIRDRAACGDAGERSDDPRGRRRSGCDAAGCRGRRIEGVPVDGCFRGTDDPRLPGNRKRPRLRSLPASRSSASPHWRPRGGHGREAMKRPLA